MPECRRTPLGRETLCGEGARLTCGAQGPSQTRQSPEHRQDSPPMIRLKVSTHSSNRASSTCFLAEHVHSQFSLPEMFFWSGLALELYPVVLRTYPCQRSGTTWSVRDPGRLSQTQGEHPTHRATTRALSQKYSKGNKKTDKKEALVKFLTTGSMRTSQGEQEHPEVSQGHKSKKH